MATSTVKKDVKCGLCTYFQSTHVEAGICRRYPPMPSSISSQTQPVVFANTTYCGEFKAVPKKRTYTKKKTVTKK